MPQLVKGEKWVFGWCIFGPAGEIQIPPKGLLEYGFRPGETVLIFSCSQSSGSIGVGWQENLANSPVQVRAIGQATIDLSGRLALPTAAGMQPGEQLLAVRGSGLALGFVQLGPIFEEALKHPDIEIFMVA